MRTAIKYGMSMAVLAGVLVSSAQAQTGGVVVMRKAIPIRIDKGLVPPSTTPTPTTTPTPSATPTPTGAAYYSWTVTGWTQSNGACGSTGTETRNVACKNTDGLVAADSLCAGNGSGPKPIASRAATITATCSYSWQAGEWPTPEASCGDVSQTRTVSCLRSDGTPSTLCAPATKPSDSRTVSDLSACTFGWSTSAWSAPSNSCGANTDTRAVSCRRSDGPAVADASCANAGPKPVGTQDDYQTTGCSTHWTTNEWGTPIPACGPSTSSRSVTCIRADGATVDDASCTDPKPITSKAATDYSTCAATGDPRSPDQPYNWTAGAFGALSTTCGAATKTRTVQCLDNSGATVADSMCAGVRPSRTLSSYETSGCTASWSTGDFGTPQPACGATVQTRSVSCVRSDGVSIGGAACGAPQPDSSQAATDYSACSFGWTASAWSAVSATCGAATQTRAVSCQRSDGGTAPDASCDPKTKPDTTQNSYQTSGCGLSWNAAPWSDAVPACGSSSETRVVTCLRADGQTVDDAQCSIIGGKPATSRTVDDYSTCSFAWAVGAYSDPTTTCGASTQNRNVTCMRSDGKTQDDGACSAIGAKPDSSQTTLQTSGCTYAWTPAPFGAAAPACGDSIHSRTVSCQRSDGTTVDSTNCAGAAPATSEATMDYSTCSYDWSVAAWNGAGGCGDTVTQRRSVTCLRSTNDTVVDSYCTTTKPAASQIITDYSACSYSWSQTVGPWSSTCSSAATRTNVVTCVRQDGNTVDDSFCTTSKPSTSDTKAVLTSCGYTPTYAAAGSVCTPTGSAAGTGTGSGTSAAPLTSCMRYDKNASAPAVDVAADNVAASYLYCAASQPVACTKTYTGTYGTVGACTATSPGATTGTQSVSAMTACKDEAGVSVSTAYCKASGTQSCTKTYTPTYSAYGICTPTTQGATTGTESRTVSTCKDEAGTSVSTSYCTASATQACTISKYTPTYLTAYSACTSGTQSAPIATCTVTATDSHNGAVNGALCPVTSTSRSCAPVGCGVWVTHTYPTSGTLVTLATGVSGTAAQQHATAKTLCENYASSNQVQGTCAVETVSGYNVYFNAGNLTPQTQSYFSADAAVCRTGPSCGVPAVNNYVTTANLVTIQASGVASAIDAQAQCNTYASTNGTSGACLWNSTNKAAYMSVGGSVVPQTQANLYASTCQ